MSRSFAWLVSALKDIEVFCALNDLPATGKNVAEAVTSLEKEACESKSLNRTTGQEPENDCGLGF